MKGLVLAALAAAWLAPRAAHAKGCHEVSDVVGLQHCSRFGMWSREADLPRFWLELGHFSHTFTVQPFTLAAAPLAMSSATVTTSTRGLETTATGVPVRVMFGLGHVLYTGIELRGGDFDSMPHIAGVPPTYGTYFGAGAVVGAHVERYRLGLSGELVAGARYADFVFCVPGTDCKGTHDAEHGEGALELSARVRGDFYFHPHLTIGVSYGHSLRELDDHVVMVTAAIHIRAMDGMW